MRSIFLLFCFFLLLQSCQEVDPNQQIDEGEVKGKTYHSDAVGWTIEIPEGYAVTLMEDKEESFDRAVDAMGETISEEADLGAIQHLIGFQKGVFNQLQSNIEPYVEEYEGQWMEEHVMLKDYLYELFTSKGIKIDSSSSTEMIDGLEFQVLKHAMYAPDDPEKVMLYNNSYSRIINGYTLSVTIGYNDEQHKKELLTAWRNSKFEKPKAETPVEQPD